MLLTIQPINLRKGRSELSIEMSMLFESYLSVKVFQGFGKYFP